MGKWRNRLGGGDLRSIGEADEIVRSIGGQEDFDEIFCELSADDRLVVMRAADVIEKASREHPEYLEKHKKQIFALCRRSQDKELRWHLALLIVRLPLSEQEKKDAWKQLSEWAAQPAESRIVRVNALQGLYEIMKMDGSFRQNFLALANEVEKHKIPSLNARLRKLRKLL